MLHEATPTQREEGGPKVVILTSTRELCMQLEEQTQQIVQGMYIQVLSEYLGVEESVLISELS